MKDDDNMYTSGEYLKNNPTWHREDSAWKVKYIFHVCKDEFLKKNFKNKSITVADIGCGMGGVIGHFTRELGNKGFNAGKSAGFDMAGDVLNMAREEWKNIEFVNGGIESLNSNFDMGLLIDVVEHVEDPDALIKAAGRFCKYLVFHIPLDDNYNFNFRDVRRKYLIEVCGHINRYNSQSALSLLRRNGMEVKDYTYTRMFIHPSARKGLGAKVIFLPKLLLSFVSKPLCARVLGGINIMVLARSMIYEER